MEPVNVSYETIGRLSEAISNIHETRATYLALTTIRPLTLDETAETDALHETSQQMVDSFLDIIFLDILSPFPHNTYAQRVALVHAAWMIILRVLMDTVHGFRNHNPATAHRKEATLAVNILDMTLELTLEILGLAPLSGADKSRFDVLVASLREYSLGQEL